MNLNFWTRTYFFFVNEIRQYKRAPLPIILAVIMPMAAWFVLALTFQHSSVEKVPISVVDLDNSQLSRKIIRTFDVIEALKVAEVTQDENAARESVKKGETLAIVYFGKDFEKNIKKGMGSKVSVVCNSGMLLYSKTVYKYVAQVLKGYSDQVIVDKMIDQGMFPRQAIVRATPVTTELQVKGNPYFDYAIYLLPGMMISILQMSASFSCLWVFRLRRESEKGRVIPNKHNKIPFLIGRITPLFFANLLSLISIFTIFLPMTGVVITHSLLPMFGLAVLYMIVSMSMGIFMSIALANLVTSSQMLLLINAPSFVFSGYTYPRWAMPHIIALFAKIIPVTNFLDGFFPMYLYDTPTMKGVVPLLISCGVLWSLTAIALSGFGKTLRTLFNKNQLK